MSRLAAKWRQGAAALSLLLALLPAAAQQPADAAAGGARPQTPQPPFAYRTEEVSFLNAADSVLLAGTLTFPEGYTPRRAARTPVVVMVTGSGVQNRDEEVFGHRPFAVLADYLARHGIASLRYDDRGAGQSGGNAAGATVASNLRDAQAAVAYLRQRGGFGKVGMLGHSEGGLIAFLAAGSPKKTGPSGRLVPDYVVSLAGPGVGGDSILLYQNRRGLREAGLSADVADSYCDVLARLFELRRSSPGLVINVARVDSVAAAVAPALPVGLRLNLHHFCTGRNPWLDSFITSDPAVVLRGVTCPVMAVAGTLDVQVIPDAGVRAIARHLPRHRRHLLKEYDGLNHLFQHCTTGAVREYAQIEETFAGEVLADIAAWILRVAR